VCESNVYLLKEGGEELLMESVDVVRPEDGKVYIQNIFGDQKSVKGRIKELRLLDHRILIEQI